MHGNLNDLKNDLLHKHWKHACNWTGSCKIRAHLHPIRLETLQVCTPAEYQTLLKETPIPDS